MLFSYIQILSTDNRTQDLTLATHIGIKALFVRLNEKMKQNLRGARIAKLRIGSHLFGGVYLKLLSAKAGVLSVQGSWKHLSASFVILVIYLCNRK